MEELGIGVEGERGALKLSELSDDGVHSHQRLEIDLAHFVLHGVIEVDQIAQVDSPREEGNQRTITSWEWKEEAGHR